MLIVNPAIVYSGWSIALFYALSLLSYLLLIYCVVVFYAVYIAHSVYRGSSSWFIRGSIRGSMLSVINHGFAIRWSSIHLLPVFIKWSLFYYLLEALYKYELLFRFLALFALHHALYYLHSRERHTCRLRSVVCLSLAGLATNVPSTIFGACLCYELFYPTLGDDGSDSDGVEFVDETMFNSAPHEPIHPGYAGTSTRLSEPWSMPPDGLCLYHCLSAATNYDQYLSSSHADRVTMAQQLRSKTIQLLKEQGLTGQARRLEKSGYAGYPDEPDFF